jgi:Zn finger protein HypA/HybF involved in hydrogenase expression
MLNMVSDCCERAYRVVGRTTQHYECRGCGQPCNVVTAKPVNRVKECPRCHGAATSVDGGVTYQCGRLHQFRGSAAMDWTGR